jgi:hypothetical protein
VDTERPKQAANVVPDGLVAEMELGRDLLRRPALFQEAQHFDLARVRCGCGAAAVSAGLPSIKPKTPTIRSPLISGTALSSTATRVPAVETRTPVVSVAGAVPSTLRENDSRARWLSSGATTEVKCLPRTSPSSRSAAGLIQRTTPVVSRR